MDGIIANLQGVCDLADKYGAIVMVDDSHAVGFVGENGRGSAEYCGVEGRVGIITGTLGKALGGASGGYTSAKAEVVDWLRQRSRPYLFSNTLAPVIAAASLKVFDLIEQGGDLRNRLKANAELFRREMTGLGFTLAGRSPHHSGNAGRRGACAGNGRTDAGQGRLCHRFFFSGCAEGAGAYSYADVGCPLRAGCAPGHCSV